MESALTTTPSTLRASLIARADLPEAVGPAMRIAPSECPAVDARAVTRRMFYVATLLCNPAAPPLTLTDDMAREAADFLPFGRLGRRLGPAAVDVVIQPDEPRRKRLFLADMDSTVIEQECIDEFADFVGLKSEVAAITERAMNGAVAFEPALRERVALLKGLPVAVVDEIIRERIRLTPGGRTLLATLRANGTHSCLVSGGFTLFTGPIAAAIRFDEHPSNRPPLG